MVPVRHRVSPSDVRADEVPELLQRARTLTI